MDDGSESVCLEAAYRISQGFQIWPTSPALPCQRTEPVRIPRVSAEMSAEPDGKQITPRGAFRHMKFLRDDGGAADLVVVKHSVCGPAFRFSAGPVREEDHPPERFRIRHVVAFPGSVVLLRLAEDLLHADSMICSDFFVVFTHDVKLHLSVWICAVRLCDWDLHVQMYDSSGGERFMRVPFGLRES